MDLRSAWETVVCIGGLGFLTLGFGFSLRFVVCDLGGIGIGLSLEIRNGQFGDLEYLSIRV